MTVFRAYSRASRYYAPDSGRIIFSTVLVAVSTLAELAQPFPLSILIDSVLGTSRPNQWVYRLFFSVAPQGKVGQIVLLASTVLVLRLFQELVNLWNGVYKIRIGFNGLLRVRRDLFQKLLGLSLGYHRTRTQGDLIYRLGSDTNSFQAAFNILQTIFVNSAKLVLLGFIMVGMNWKLGLIAVAIMPVLFWTISQYGRIIMTTSARAAQVEAQLTTTIQRSVASIGLVQAFGREDDEYNRFDNGVRNSHDAWASMHTHTLVYWVIMGMTFALGLATIIGYGGYLALQGTLTIGFLQAFVVYLLTQFYDPLYKLSGSGADLRRYMAGMERVYEVLDTPSLVEDKPDAIDLPRKPRVLTLEHVSFAYKEAAPVLKDVSVTVKPGEMVAFVGPSGVGKSSLLGLLPRFYDPTSGALKLDGHDLRDVKLQALRSHIALVLQENIILAATVAENIAYGRPDATLEEIRTAARQSGADTFIQAGALQYNAILDEGGQNLSGGQRQRISIARALLTEAPILVLDEPTSALDPTNEKMITETLTALKGTRTMILVSHRLSTVADCDRIYVMDAGRIVEQGSHDELLAQRGQYYEMARHQLKIDDATPEVAPA